MSEDWKLIINTQAAKTKQATCCYCRTNIDLQSPSGSAFFCCTYQNALCRNCTKFSCPSCDKKMTYKLDKSILNSKIKAKLVIQEAIPQPAKQNTNTIKNHQQKDSQSLEFITQRKSHIPTDRKPEHFKHVNKICLACGYQIRQSVYQSDRQGKSQDDGIVLCRACQKNNLKFFAQTQKQVKKEPVLYLKPIPIQSAINTNNPNQLFKERPDLLFKKKPDPMLQEKPDPLQKEKTNPLLVNKPDLLLKEKPDPLLISKPDSLLISKSDSLLISKHDPLLISKHDPLLISKHDPVLKEKTCIECDKRIEESGIIQGEMSEQAGFYICRRCKIKCQRQQSYLSQSKRQQQKIKHLNKSQLKNEQIWQQQQELVDSQQYLGKRKFKQESNKMAANMISSISETVIVRSKSDDLTDNKRKYSIQEPAQTQSLQITLYQNPSYQIPNPQIQNSNFKFSKPPNLYQQKQIQCALSFSQFDNQIISCMVCKYSISHSKGYYYSFDSNQVESAQNQKYKSEKEIIESSLWFLCSHCVRRNIIIQKSQKDFKIDYKENGQEQYIMKNGFRIYS